MRTLALEIALLGPIGRHSKRPALLATGLAAATYWFLPAAWPARAVCVGLVIVLAEICVRMTDHFTERATSEIGDVVALPLETPGDRIVIDRWAGMWATLLPLREHVALLAAAWALFVLFESRQVGPVGWVSRWRGSSRTAADDVVASALAAVPLVVADRLLL